MIPTTDDIILKMYLDTKSDYRNAQNLEQTILNFGVAILAAFASVGFSHLGELISWFIFDLFVPFYIAMVSILYLHQKHRSKSYKAYIFFLERNYSNKLGNIQTFERWKKKNVAAFIQNRIGFKYCSFFILLSSPIAFIIIGDTFCKQEASIYGWIGWVIKAIVFASYYICFRYYQSIKSLEI